MSVIGGSNSNSLLPYLDFEALRRDPKVIVGYSDVTALLLGIYAQTGLVTFYGPALVASFGELPPLVDKNPDLAEQVEDLHKQIGSWGYYLIALHVVAALFHHYVKRDNTLRRISPFKTE